MPDNSTNKDGMTLGKYIAQKRQEKNLSQRELARDIAISHSTISRIEKDQGISPDNATLRAVSEKLGVDYNYLLALNKSIDDEPVVREIQKIVRKMNDAQKKRMMNILKATFEELFDEEE